MARVVMFVTNDVRWDARVQREARTLAQAGYVVTVVGRPSDPAATDAERETMDGFSILRVPIPGGFRRRMLTAGGGRGPGAGAAAGTEASAGTPKPDATDGMSIARILVRSARTAARIPVLGGIILGIDLLVRWRFGVVAWGRAAAAATGPADVWHAHDLSGVPAALAARARHGGRLVYDAHELFTEAGDTAIRPRWARARLRRFEARVIRAADAVITVNDGLADELRRIAIPRRLVVVRNAPPAPAMLPSGSAVRAGGPVQARDHLRAALDLPAATPIVLYHGGFLPDRGLPELIHAMRLPGLERAHLVLMGSGSMTANLQAAAAEPRLGGRVHLLPPVPPAELVDWVASADVGAMPNQPRTANERISTPNKLFECLAAGVPVVSSDFPERRRIVMDDPDGPLGAMCDPTNPGSIAAALASILDLDEAAGADLRARCLRAARERWNWESQSAGLLELYADLTSTTTVSNDGGDDPEPVPQRITFVLPSSGAFDARTRRMASGLAGRGHDVLVIARSEPGLPDRERIAPGALLVRVDAGAAPALAKVAGAPRRMGGPAGFPAEARRIVSTARRTDIQTDRARRVDRPAAIYHAMGFLALPVAMDLAGRSGSPFVYDARDLYAAGNNIARLPALLRAAFAWRERSWARRAAAVLTVNDALADELERRLGVPRPAVVMNAQVAWAPPEPRPDLLRATLNLPPTARIVLYHGGFMRDRGLPQAIAAMRTPGLEAAHLVLMGSGGLESELAELAGAADVAGRIDILPPVAPDDLLAWVASADVGVMANQPRTINERLSTPNKLFECLAAGTPVVSSDFPARRRIVIDDPEGPLGAVCDPTDPAAIGTAIRSILDLDDDAASDLRARCRRAAAARYDWETQFRTLLRTYAAVTGNPW